LKNTLPGGVDYTPAENNVTDGINAYIKFMEGEKTTQDTPITKVFKSASEVIAILKAATEAGACCGEMERLLKIEASYLRLRCKSSTLFWIKHYLCRRKLTRKLHEEDFRPWQRTRRRPNSNR